MSSTRATAGERRRGAGRGAPPRLVPVARHAEPVRERETDDRSTRTLRDLQPRRLTDRPVRRAAHETTERFGAAWGAAPTASKPTRPNAELVVLGEEPTAPTVVSSGPHRSADHPGRLSDWASLVGETAVSGSIAACRAPLLIDDAGSIEDEESMA